MGFNYSGTWHDDHLHKPGNCNDDRFSLTTLRFSYIFVFFKKTACSTRPRPCIFLTKEVRKPFKPTV